MTSMLLDLETTQATVRTLGARLRVSSLARRVLSGICWTVIGTGLARGLGLLASIAVARLVGKAEFGALGMIQSTVGMFGAIAGLGLGTTATKYVAQYRLTDPERAGRVIRLSRMVSWTASALMTIALLASSSWLAAKSLNAPQLAMALRIGSLLILFGGVNGAQTGALAGLESFRSIAKINAAVGLLNFPILTLAAYFWGLKGTVCGLVLNLALNCLINFVVLQREMRRNRIPSAPAGTLGEFSIIWNFSLPVTLTSLLLGPANWASSALLASAPGGYAALGAFSAANQCRTLVILIPAMLAGVAMPTLSNLHGLADLRGYRKVLFLNLFATAGVAGLIASVIALFAQPIAATYGRAFADSVPVIRWMALSGFLVAINSLAALVLESLGRAWTGLVFCLLCSLSLVMWAYALVPSHGAYGLAVANTLAYGLHTIWQGAFIYRLLKLQAV
jgi:O-antigen/teichoic acid export membrane protein